MASRAYEIVKAWRLANPGARAKEAQRYRARHPEKRKIIADRYRERHLEKIRASDRAAQANRRKSDPEGYRRRYLKWRENKENQLTIMAGRPRPEKCELCGGNEGRIVFDHCHASGKFRGWLCDRCNKILGLVKDSGPLLRRMAAYLEKDHGATDFACANGPSDSEIRRPESLLSD